MFGNYFGKIILSFFSFFLLTVILHGGFRGYLKSLFVSLKRLLTTREYLLYFLGILLLLLLDVLELKGESGFPSSYLYSYFIAKIEAPLIIKLQSFQPAWLVFLLSYVYVFLFPVLFAAILYYGLINDQKTLIAGLFYIYLINYLVAMPFYVNLPVYEAWSIHPGIKLLLVKYYPQFNVEYRSFSGINNNFPSLHTALSVSFFYLAFKLRDKRLTGVLGVSSSLIVISTIYLGIHWIIDIIAGIFLGVGVVYFYTYQIEEREFMVNFYKKLAFAFLAIVFFLGGLVNGAPHAEKYYAYFKQQVSYMEIQEKAATKLKSLYDVFKNEFKEFSDRL
ncbi:phosphatase PAP2 family protein [Carboxydothermus hydrogenoformans]|uniref:PAP2 family protein n=1 Tax=Carboxydothermus hydrogenoformans (strain ATCC BAA-161 / DSM 6008 / Z-2901) TaxID=246194 RepID=Q3AEK7_CARHZ|nr:phosphatase PAP2 family protein [Carboxydothermus hydrogenoformans]ABB13875.1 PAP2 family protein [Carboxydothermus hydrogenoformans Z-2901]